MKKIKIRTIYLITLIVGGLIGLATKSTYALFTSSTEIDNPICMSTNLTSEEEVVDTIDVTIVSGEVKEVPITINNTSSSSLNYMVFYNPTSSDIEIGVNMKNTDSSNSSGTIKIGETKKVYVQIKNNSSSSITITLGVVSNSISSDMNMVPSGKDGESTITIGTNLAEYITSLYTNATKKTVTNNSIKYNYATAVGLMNDRLGNSSTDLDAGNIRYYGTLPDNYIYFNCDDYSNQTLSTCETWRIVGIFDGKVKIMKNENIGTYSFDNKDTTTGSENDSGTNNWTIARLMRLLNPSDYYTVDTNDNGNGQSLYWSGASGTCFAGASNATVSCDFTSSSSTKGLKNSVTRNMISESIWYLKGYTSSVVYSNQMYNYEITSGSVYAGSSPSWKGKVALIYPSDYGYAADFRYCTKQLTYYSDTTCTGNNWMKNIITNNGNTHGWLLTPYSSSYQLMWHIYNSGAVNSYTNSASSLNVVPTLYLNSNISIKDGTDGTASNPFKLIP